ncbi:major facilitator superfamily domain-containing protein [Sparassis latifolia]|uniref:Aspyridones efflux protein n=1 Tax=Sparassis crispa TaxID=139825 RepID=A0A401H129_9APHY|nr:Aspyridones efflux protein [Sparassis crispa]GBE88131.1 Aspyridones efflux protein [Sparassis crispa]
MSAPNPNDPQTAEGDFESQSSVVNEKKPDTVVDSEFPEGGSQAVKTVWGAFCVLFVQFGVMNSFGVFESQYGEVQLKNKTPSEIAWIGTFQLFFFFFTGAFVGRAFDSFGPTVLIGPGSLLLVFGLMMTSLCKEYYQFFLAQGLVFGAGSALVFYPALSSIAHWYNKKRGTMMGLTTAGSSLGGVVFPIALNKLIPVVGFPWAVRIVAFICLAFLVPATMLIKSRLPHRKFNDFSSLLDFGGFTDIRYVLFLFGAVITMLGTYNPYYYVETFAVVHNYSPSVSLYILSIQNAGSFFGRIIPGVLADKIGFVNVMALACTTAGMVLFCWLSVDSAPGLIGWAVFYGFTSGAFIALMPACIGRFTPDTTKYGGRAGLLFGFVGFSALVGPPIAGALINQDHGSFQHMIIFSGVVCLVGAAFFWGARFIREPGLFVKF